MAMTDTEHASGPAPGPRFAPEAEELLGSGDVAGALALALAGAERYPWYPGGFLVLGRCQEAAGNTAGALEAFRAAARLVPGAPVLREALARLEQASGPAAAAEPPAGTPPEPPPDAMEVLARRLQEAKRIIAPAEGTGEPPPGAPDDAAGRQGAASGPQLVSATLAEIYVEQRQFGEAIRAYRTLIERQPAEQEKYERRIAEIEEMARRDTPGA